MSALEMVHSWPVETVAAGWVDRRDGRQTTGDADRPFALASVTKPLFAYAILIAIEEGTLALDQPGGPPGSTVRHLLAHASGLGDDEAKPLTEVANRRIYSNSAFEILGDMLAAASGIGADLYASEAVFEPLGMTATALVGSPAHGARSTVDDLLTLATEWLSPTLIDRSTMQAATSVQFAELIGVLPGYGRQAPNPWGLGFELKGPKNPHWTGALNSPATFGHFGRAGTFIWVDPDIQAACVVLTDREFGSWAQPLWPAVSDEVVTEARARQ